MQNDRANADKSRRKRAVDDLLNVLREILESNRYLPRTDRQMIEVALDHYTTLSTCGLIPSIPDRFNVRLGGRELRIDSQGYIVVFDEAGNFEQYLETLPGGRGPRLSGSNYLRPALLKAPFAFLSILIGPLDASAFLGDLEERYGGRTSAVYWLQLGSSILPLLVHKISTILGVERIIRRILK